MFIDEIEITLKAGNGGNGIVSFFPGKKSGPDGGRGGEGGDLFVYASSNMTNLNQYADKKIIEAEDGRIGGKNKKSGAKGKNLELALPKSTILIDTQTNEELELLCENEKILVCKGGFGGRGNSELKSSLNTTPREAENGAEGQKRYFKIIVKMVADYGLIGLPNAGKSSLLNELTNAKSVVANYPFTTLEPSLGVLCSFNGKPQGESKIIADIPGLIEGASNGKGLGIKFLKHIEKVKLLLHCIDSNSDDVTGDYETVMAELEKYNIEVAKKKQIILLTKSDMINAKDMQSKLKKLKRIQKNVLGVSIYDWESLQTLYVLIHP